MLDKFTFEKCKEDLGVLNLKINTLEYAIDQSEKIIKESQLSNSELTFLRRKLAESINELDQLYILKKASSDS